MMNGEIHLSGEDVCKLPYISKRTLQHYRDNHILPYVQVRGKIIFRQPGILRVLERNYVTKTQEERTNDGTTVKTKKVLDNSFIPCYIGVIG